ncbi:SCF ubiquitin ligase complex subunit [Saccharomycopsis crataegensis]|uniref:SCF ubiquitin ligase complex subunit n=1 Tax=Saccharomycopsis crataegensis TaxID=43959 RepID=A0AAV5QL25_9ASCO|nr:SCF ubiquitin ligase complex subunit [Saccharomycopsis crataegensis]
MYSSGSHKSILCFPDHLLQYLFEFLPQETILNVILSNKLFHSLGSKKLYRKIYLSDSIIANTSEYNVGRLWSVLKVSKKYRDYLRDDLVKKTIDNVFDIGDVRYGEEEILQILNGKLQRLISTLENSKSNYRDFVQEIWIDQDLNYELQEHLIKYVMNHSNSIRLIHSVIDKDIMYIINNGNPQIKKNLQSLELSPEHYFPTQISTEYLKSLNDIMVNAIHDKNRQFKSLSLFANPMALLNCMNLEKDSRIEVESLTYHVRNDRFPNSIRQENGMKLEKLSDLIDPESLKSLTITCWMVEESQDAADKTFSDKIWSGFNNIEEVAFISMIVDERLIIDFISQTKSKLRRFRFHYALPRYHLVDSNSPLLNSLKKYHGNSIEYLDINFHDDDYEFYWYNIFESKVEFNNAEFDEFGVKNTGCFCDDCIYTKQSIIKEKLFKNKLEEIEEQEFRAKNIGSIIFSKGLIPYTFSFDKYPSFINVLKIENFLKRFNALHEVELDFQEFNLIYQTLIHHMRPAVQFFISSFPELKRLVLNDIPFMIVETESDGKIGKSVFSLKSM